MESTFHPPVQLVLKNNTWVPRHKKHLSILDQHGVELKKTLGEGSYAKVKLAFSSKENKNIAVKIFEKRRLPRLYVEKFMIREVKILTTLQHPHVICMKDIFESASKIYMVLELAEGGDLLEYVNSKKYTTEEQIKLHFQQILSGLSACHEQFIVHRDLKCENILLDEKNNVKLGDFGFSRNITKGMLLDTFCGSFAYSSPELIAAKTGYDGFAADCWSLGTILYCMLCGSLPYEREELLSLSKGKRVNPIQFGDGVSEEAKVVVRNLLQPDRRNRYTCNDLKQADWCKDYHVTRTEPLEYFNDIIAARNTVASEQNKHPLNMLTNTVRPNYGKFFYKVISRQRFNLMAITAFNKRPVIITAGTAEPSASFYVQSPTEKRARRTSIVSDVLKCDKIITNERRKTLESEKQIKDQLRYTQLVKDLEIKTTTKKLMPTEKSSSRISQSAYEDFLGKKRKQRDKECHDITRSSSSLMARKVCAQKQISKVSTANNKSECFFEADAGDDQQEDWVRKCMMSCTRAH